MIAEETTVLDHVRIQTEDDNVQPVPSDEFVCTPRVQALTERATAYLNAAYSVHFAGPAGTGKTTLAFHVAAQRGRPVTLIHGDDEFGSSDLVGRDSGYRKKKLIDNFIHSVLKTEEEAQSLWIDNRLTTACKNGETLIYDEFTRSRPEANNALLSVLSEKILNLPKLRRSGEAYLQVHPDFRAIFTSNPAEYAGVHKTQDALMDRLITISLDHHDLETEVEITMAKSGIVRQDAEAIVHAFRALRDVRGDSPTIRACIAVARVLVQQGARARANDRTFRWVCQDVLDMDTTKTSRNEEPLTPQLVDGVIKKFCKPVRARRAAATGGDGSVTREERTGGSAQKRIERRPNDVRPVDRDEQSATEIPEAGNAGNGKSASRQGTGFCASAD